MKRIITREEDVNIIYKGSNHPEVEMSKKESETYLEYSRRIKSENIELPNFLGVLLFKLNYDIPNEPETWNAVITNSHFKVPTDLNMHEWCVLPVNDRTGIHWYQWCPATEWGGVDVLNVSNHYCAEYKINDFGVTELDGVKYGFLMKGSNTANMWKSKKDSDIWNYVGKEEFHTRTF